MAYTFDPVFAVDPNNPANIAKNATITIFDPADVAQAPIAIKDPTGSPLPNPITVDAAGMGPAYQHPTLARVGWKGAGFVGYFTSYEGMYNETIAAKDAAQAAVGDAQAAAAERVTSASVNPAGKLILTKASGVNVDAGTVLGPKGDKGDRGLDGSNVLPTQEAIEQALTTDGPAKRALDSTYAPSSFITRATPSRPWPATSIISSVQSGHGFTSTGAGTFNLNDTSDYVIGSQSISITTDGVGGQASIKKSGLALNMTGKGLLLWVKITASAMNKLNYLTIDLGGPDANLGNYFRGFVWNTAGMLKTGEWLPVQVPWAYFTNVINSPNRASIDTIRILTADTAGGSVKVNIGGVATYAEGSTKFPNGVVSFTFDDSFQSAYSVGLAKLSQHGYRGTLYPILSRLDTGSYLTTGQLKMMQTVHGWEIGTHATSDATHVDYNTRTPAQIDTELRALRAWQSANGITSSSFAYPSGAFSPSIVAQVLPYYSSARANYNHPTTPVTNQPHRIAGMVLGTSTTLAAAKTRVDQIVAAGGWQPFVIHDLVTPTTTSNDWVPADFNALVDYCVSKGVAVLPVGEVIAATS